MSQIQWNFRILQNLFLNRVSWLPPPLFQTQISVNKVSMAFSPHFGHRFLQTKNPWLFHSISATDSHKSKFHGPFTSFRPQIPPNQNSMAFSLYFDHRSPQIKIPWPFHLISTTDFFKPNFHGLFTPFQPQISSNQISMALPLNLTHNHTSSLTPNYYRPPSSSSITSIP
jgi:hypothetical protein